MEEVWNDFKDEIRDLYNWLIKTSIATAKNALKLTKRLLKWIGQCGLLKLETSALIVCTFGIFCSEILSAFLALLILEGKSVYDNYFNGHNDEFHDFVCFIFGIVLGMVFIYVL